MKAENNVSKDPRTCVDAKEPGSLEAEVPCYNLFEILGDLEYVSSNCPYSKLPPWQKRWKGKNSPSNPDWWGSGTANEFPLPKRSGVIPFTSYKGKLYFCLGIDKISGELTDFGGGVKLTDKTPVHAAIREFRDESKGVFSSCYDLNRVKYSSFSLFHGDFLIIFLYVPDHYLHLAGERFIMKTKSVYDEVIGITWYPEEDFQEAFFFPRTSGRLKRAYTQIKEVLRNQVRFSQLRTELRRIARRKFQPRLTRSRSSSFDNTTESSQLSPRWHGAVRASPVPRHFSNVGVEQFTNEDLEPPKLVRKVPREVPEYKKPVSAFSEYKVTKPTTTRQTPVPVAQSAPDRRPATVDGIFIFLDAKSAGPCFPFSEIPPTYSKGFLEPTPFKNMWRYVRPFLESHEEEKLPT